MSNLNLQSIKTLLNQRQNVGKIKFSFPKLIISLFAKKFFQAVFYQETTQKVIALTIDDVPTPNEVDNYSTQLILDALAEHNAKATFFMISSHLGNNKTLINKILSKGYEIGNHGVNDETHAKLNPKKFEKQFNQAHQQLTEGTNLTTIRWYRPGRAFYNQPMLEALKNKSEYIPKFALASMIPLDTYKLTNSPKFTAWYVSLFIFPGSILVFHGGNEQRSENTAKALNHILARLQQDNYQVVTMTELWEIYASKS